MGKYETPRPTSPKRPLRGLPLAMLIYAGVFLLIAAIGIVWFWNYISAYEASRPKTTMTAYVEQLDLDRLYKHAEPLVAAIDKNLQTDAQSRAYFDETIGGKITYAQKFSVSTDEKTVYAVLSNGKTIGQITLTAQPANAFGFRDWVVSEETYDFSFLLGKAATITVPHTFSVYAGDFRLPDSYIAEDRIAYEALKEFHDDYTVPYRVTYKASPVFGELTLRATDPNGQEVTIDENTDYNVFLDNCTDDEKTAVQKIMVDFVEDYIAYTSTTGGNPYNNFYKLSLHMVPNGELYKRMQNALGGMLWVSDRSAKILSITPHRFVNIGDGRYMCDVTFIANITTRFGEIQTATNNSKLIFLMTDNGLKAEAMVSY